MNINKYTLLLLTISCLLWTGLSCQNQSGKRVIAKVNNEVITEAEFVQTLPGGFTSDSIEQSYRINLIDQMIIKKLFIQQAIKLGLDQEISPVLERDKQSMMIQALYDDVVTKNLKSTPKEIENAKKLLATETHLRLIITEDEATANLASAEIKQGVSFDTVALKYSAGPALDQGGDIGFIPLLYLEEEVRNVILKMKPGEISNPIQCEEDYKIVQLLEKQTSTEPSQSLHDNAKMALEQEKSRKLATSYLKKLFSRLEYNPEGLSLFHKNVDSITPVEGEIWVVKKDNKKIVYAKNLMHVARQFPVTLDTAMRTYAIKREIEDDMLYEDALARGLDKTSNALQDIRSREKDLLYEKYYLTEITQKIDISPEEIEAYYNANKEKYPDTKLADATPMIRNILFGEKRQARYQAVIDSLKSNATIEINEKLVATVSKPEKKIKK
ncbi:MAG: peptidylprolyl isomerase [Candidatus Latescibacteria bacterium]|nr:peptidylprolyl isomerase [Candidatus Latescibacterota bacterium]